jgi:hypothetical protein
VADTKPSGLQGNGCHSETTNKPTPATTTTATTATSRAMAAIVRQLINLHQQQQHQQHQQQQQQQQQQAGQWPPGRPTVLTPGTAQTTLEMWRYQPCQTSYSACGAFGLIETTFRELDWKTLVFFERAVAISPNTWYVRTRAVCHSSPEYLAPIGILHTNENGRGRLAEDCFKAVLRLFL